VRASTPVLALCRKLVDAGHNPSSRLDALFKTRDVQLSLPLNDEAIDPLQEFAARAGLDQDATQQILADAFAPYREAAL